MKKIILALVTAYVGLVLIINFQALSSLRDKGALSEDLGWSVAIFEQPLIIILSIIPGTGVGDVHTSAASIAGELEGLTIASIVLLAFLYALYFHSTSQKKKMVAVILVGIIGISSVHAYVLFSVGPGATESLSSQAYKKAFVGREGIYVAIDKALADRSDCAYAQDLLDTASAEGADTAARSIRCVEWLDDDAKFAKQFPLDIQRGCAFAYMNKVEGGKLVMENARGEYQSYPTIGYEKGDVFAVTAYVPKGGYLGLEVLGNSVSALSRLGAFSCDGEESRGQSGEILVGPFDRDSVYTMLYPINMEDVKGTDDIKNAGYMKKLEMYAWLPEGRSESIRILEVARIR
jgi:hypothetical protein